MFSLTYFDLEYEILLFKNNFCEKIVFFFRIYVDSQNSVTGIKSEMIVV